MKKNLLTIAACLLTIGSIAQVQLYGTTFRGGPDDWGTIFHYDISTGVHTVDQSFSSTIPGATPQYATLTEGANHKFYAMTSVGGKYNKGVIFEWDPVTNIYTDKFDFNTISNGINPHGSLTYFGGKFYGMTNTGGSNIYYGVIFEWDPVTNIYTKKIDFKGPNGGAPEGSLVVSGNKLYGMTSYGGGFSGGVVFEWDPVTNVYTIEVELNTDGNTPYGSLVVSAGKFYGMTNRGGTSDLGVIFEWDPVTNIYTKKIDFDNSNGASPYGSLALNAGKFYGMTKSGGANSYGVIFEWDPITNIYAKKIELDLYASEPYGSLTLSAGKFYGMTSTGFANISNIGNGVIFEWDPVTNIITNKADLGGRKGAKPNGSLTLSQGKLYGMTPTQGPSGKGTIFEFDPVKNAFTRKIGFSETDGRYPTSTLILHDNKFYGMTGLGGMNNAGVIFEYNPVTNIYTKKIDFDSLEGFSPSGALALFNGKFYGMTSRGGLNNGGVIFEWDPVTNIYTKEIDFDVSRGFWPSGSLTLNAGKFYGLTYLGGSNNGGTIFEWDPATNIYTKKVDFSDIEGMEPLGTLALSSGKFYGMTNRGGINLSGVIFEWDPATSIYTKKIDFNGPNGIYPIGYDALSFNSGKFYGVTSSGGVTAGNYQAGVIFEWDPISNIYTKKIDFDKFNNGASPVASLTLQSGKFYGTTSQGGSNFGVIFEWDPASNIYVKKFVFNGINGNAPLGTLTQQYINSPLPIKLVSFNAMLQNNNNAKLQWQIASPEDGSRYELQRGSNTNSFMTINQQTGSALLTEFSYTDRSLSNGTYYYRLKIIDKENRTTYSQIIKIEFGSEKILQVFPNPAKNTITISGLDNKGFIKIISADGKLVKQLSVTANSMPVDIRTLPSGIYLVQYNNGEKTSQVKIIRNN